MCLINLEHYICVKTTNYFEIQYGRRFVIEINHRSHNYEHDIFRKSGASKPMLASTYQTNPNVELIVISIRSVYLSMKGAVMLMSIARW